MLFFDMLWFYPAKSFVSQQLCDFPRHKDKGMGKTTHQVEESLWAKMVTWTGYNSVHSINDTPYQQENILWHQVSFSWSLFKYKRQACLSQDKDICVMLTTKTQIHKNMGTFSMNFDLSYTYKQNFMSLKEKNLPLPIHFTGSYFVTIPPMKWVSEFS